jgi:DNA polymerase (family 10)
MVESTLAQSVADEIIVKLKSHVTKILVCGSLRRKATLVHDIDIVVAGPDEEFYKLMNNMKLTGDKVKWNFGYRGVPVDITLTNSKLWGAAIMHFTGSKDFNIGCRVLANQKGLKLSQYGLTNPVTQELIAGENELAIFNALHIAWLEPEDREWSNIKKE